MAHVRPTHSADGRPCQGCATASIREVSGWRARYGCPGCLFAKAPGLACVPRGPYSGLGTEDRLPSTRSHPLPKTGAPSGAPFFCAVLRRRAQHIFEESDCTVKHSFVHLCTFMYIAGHEPFQSGRAVGYGAKCLLRGGDRYRPYESRPGRCYGLHQAIHG